MMFKLIYNSISLIFQLLKIQFRNKSKENILLVAEYGKNGGTRTYFISLLHFFKEQGVTVSVLVNSKVADEEIYNLIHLLGYEIVDSNFDFWCTDFRNIPQGLTKKTLWNYQVNEMLMWSSLITKKKFTKLIFSVGYPEQYTYTFLMHVEIVYILHTEPVKKMDCYKHFVIKNNLSYQKRILTVSKSSKESIEYSWLKNKNNQHISYIYNFYELNNCCTTNSSDFKQIRILSIGSVESYKNPFFFIKCALEILEKVNDPSIIFTWAGDGSLLEECKKMVKGNAQIEFVGYQSNVEKLYKSSAIYFQPSLQESHGIAVVGAMSNKLPCVVSNFGGLEESVINNKTGYVIAINNTDQAIQQLIILIKDQKLSKNMGIEGFQHYEQKFTKAHWHIEMRSFFNYT